MDSGFWAYLKGKRWRFSFERLRDEWGKCSPPDQPNKTIRIHKSIRSPKKMTEVLVHEMTHAHFWDLDENAVQGFAEDVANVLDRAVKLGYIKYDKGDTECPGP